MRKFMLCASVCVLLFASDASAQGRRSRRSYVPQSVPQEVVQKENSQVVPNFKVGEVCEDALKEVNEKRAKMGLKPFINDKLLAQGALVCAKLRAASHIHGHLDSDFAHLPAGANATAAGCGALEPDWGWGTCCYTENYTYAGAAWVMGSDGRRYMHIFVR